ncbi:MAG: hypothetical protein HDS83_08125 [Bacteroidales bacterium]|nr:hypothetical protein [Bacteroidales bacterium]
MNPDQLLTELKKICKLHDEGVLSESEFKKLKKKILEQQGFTCEFKSVDLLDKPNKSIFESGYENTLDSPSQGNESQTPSSDHYVDLTDEIDSTNTIEKSKFSRKNIIIFAVVIVIIIGGFFIFGKTKHNKALEDIEQQDGTILADIKENGIQVLVYSTSEGLFYWNLKDKRPQQLYQSLDSLEVRDYYLDEKYELKYRNWIADSNIFQPNPKDLYKVKWPWIFIGQTYVANINRPKNLIRINSYKSIDGDLQSLASNQSSTEQTLDEFYINRVDSSLVLIKSIIMPGYYNYRTTELNQACWSDTAYMSEKLWELFDSYENKEELLTFVPEDNSHGFAIITIDSKNNAKLGDNIHWCDNLIPIKNGLSAHIMQPYYKEREMRLKQEVDFHKDKIIDAKNQFVNDKATDFYRLAAAYRANPYKAEVDYPVNKEYYTELTLSSISWGEKRYLYMVQADAWDRERETDYYRIYLLTDDYSFRNIEYPSKRLVKGKLAQTYLDGPRGTELVLYDAKLVF